MYLTWKINGKRCDSHLQILKELSVQDLITPVWSSPGRNYKESERVSQENCSTKVWEGLLP